MPMGCARQRPVVQHVILEMFDCLFRLRSPVPDEGPGCWPIRLSAKTGKQRGTRQHSPAVRRDGTLVFGSPSHPVREAGEMVLAGSHGRAFQQHAHHPFDHVANEGAELLGRRIVEHRGHLFSVIEVLALGQLAPGCAGSGSFRSHGHSSFPFWSGLRRHLTPSRAPLHGYFALLEIGPPCPVKHLRSARRCSASRGRCGTQCLVSVAAQAVTDGLQAVSARCSSQRRRSFDRPSGYFSSRYVTSARRSVRKNRKPARNSHQAINTWVVST